MALARSGGLRRTVSERERAALEQRLQDRRSEIEQVAFDRVEAIASPGDATEPEQAEGLRNAISAALDYSLTTAREGEAPSRIPSALLAQARVAARDGIKLDLLLRRYFAGHTLFCDFLAEEAESCGLSTGSLKYLLRLQAATCDRLLAAASEEYVREAKKLRTSTDQRGFERVSRLLAGELVDVSQLGYEIDAHHVGIVAKGPGASATIRGLVQTVDQLALVVHRDHTVWAWLGGRRAPDPKQLQHHLPSSRPGELTVSLGEPAEGLAGWRLTHRQAKAALSVALRLRQGSIRYADAVLKAAILEDDLLATSLRRLFLSPIASEPQRGLVLLETVRAYFASEHNVSSAAASLGVSRQAVARRLRTVEEKLGPLGECRSELELALMLDELEPLSSREDQSGNTM